MDKKYQIPIDGQAVTRSDMNAVFAQAATGPDNGLSLAQQPLDYVGSGLVKRGVLPPRGLPGATPQALVYPTPAGFGVTVSRHTIGIGPFVATDNKIVTVAVPSTAVVFAAGSGGANPRYDLVYATVYLNVPDTTTTRKTKGIGSKVVSSASVSPSVSNTVTINVLKGTEASTPVQPFLPADPVGGYNVPLAYVRFVGTYDPASTVTVGGDIMEIADVYTSHDRPQVIDVLSNFPGVLITSNGAAKASDPRRKGFVPKIISGGAETRDFFLRLASSGGDTAGMPNGLVLDSSVDWRKRTFWGHVQIVSSSDYPWIADGPPRSVSVGGYDYNFPIMTNSFNVYYNADSQNDFTIFRLDHSGASGLGVSDFFEIAVRSTTGNLILKTNGLWATQTTVAGWFRASGQFVNNL